MTEYLVLVDKAAAGDTSSDDLEVRPELHSASICKPGASMSAPPPPPPLERTKGPPEINRNYLLHM